MTKKKPILYAIVGPTAVGKSDFAVELARKINGEIVSADSRQVFRGLDLGTGKITNEEMKGVQHYMLDVIDVEHDYSVSEYQKGALLAIDYIMHKAKTPIICGGTGQYIHALLYKKKFPEVKPNPGLRKKLERKSADELFRMLKKKDKERAKTIDPKNKIRLIRALEILEKLPKVPKVARQIKRFPFKIYLLDLTKEKLKEKVEKRLKKRMDRGLLEETKWLMNKVGPKKDMRKYGIEYIYLAKHLNGEITLEDAEKKILSEIMKYAKRQMTWNKKFFKGAEIVKVR